MVAETDKASVICPTCRHPTDRHLGWFKTVPTWDCFFCGAALELDYAQLEKFVADQAAAGGEFVARLSPRPNRGITTRRTR